jgi:hypothetical protein
VVRPGFARAAPRIKEGKPMNTQQNRAAGQRYRFEHLSLPMVMRELYFSSADPGPGHQRCRPVPDAGDAGLLLIAGPVRNCVPVSLTSAADDLQEMRNANAP